MCRHLLGCEPGTYGRNCSGTCSPYCAEPCDKVTGVCGCKDGWTGNRCDRGTCTSSSDQEDYHIVYISMNELLVRMRFC